MITTAAPVVKIRILDDYALVPSSKGAGCYHVAIEDGAAIHCSCPDHRRRSRTCKHMDAVDAVLVGARPCVGADMYASELTPKPASKSRKAEPKTAPKAAPAAPVMGALAKVAREVELLRSELTPAILAALDDEERADAMADALGDEARDAASDADWDASYYYW